MLQGFVGYLPVANAIIALSGAVFQWHLHGLTMPFLVTLATAAFLTAVRWWAGGWYFLRRGDEALGIGEVKMGQFHPSRVFVA